MKNFNVIIEKDPDGYYIGTVPELKGCYTQAKSLDELRERIEEVILLCMEDEDSYNLNDFVGIQQVSVNI